MKQPLPRVHNPSSAQIRAIRRHRPNALDPILRDYERRVCSLALRHEQPGCDRDDLAQVGRLAICRAAEKFDADRGVPFEHYATAAIVKAMIDEQRRIGPPLVQLDEASAQWHDLCPLDFNTNLHTGELGMALSALSPSEFDVVFLIYGCGMSQRVAAGILGLSQPAVATKHRKILQRLRALYGFTANEN